MSSRKRVFGVGIYSKGLFCSNVSGVQTREYKLWSGMLRRCYRGDELTYKDCTVSGNFKNFQYFAEWCNKQVGFNEAGWELDKDILFTGNKIYSEDTCCFVPKEINLLLSSNKVNRGALPIGVNYYPPLGKYCAKLKVKGRNKHLGYFETPESAFLRYKQSKEAYIKLRADEFKDTLSEAVYLSLITIVVDSNN